MKILATGGLGTVGSFLVEELRGRGHEVWVCDLYHHHNRQSIRCDVSQYRQLERLFASHPFDYVYHLAGEFGRWNGEDFYENLWSSNAVGTKNILRMQEKYGFRLVYFSSSEVYGDWDGVMSEDVMDRFEVRQLNDYAITKWVGEMQVLNSARMFGTESVRVRLFNLYGPGEKYSDYRSVNCLFCYRRCTIFPTPFIWTTTAAQPTSLTRPALWPTSWIILFPARLTISGPASTTISRPFPTSSWKPSAKTTAR
jgi:dTDP-glucose 4,6-dehydratase